MGALLMVFFRDRPLVGMFAGLLASGPLYLMFGYVLAKFGYHRKSLKDLRVDRPTTGSGKRPDSDDGDRPRPKPAPTKRTGGVSNRPGGSRKRR
jgi:hypothetical protein